MKDWVFQTVYKENFELVIWVVLGFSGILGYEDKRRNFSPRRWRDRGGENDAVVRSTAAETGGCWIRLDVKEEKEFLAA